MAGGRRRKSLENIPSKSKKGKLFVNVSDDFEENGRSEPVSRSDEGKQTKKSKVSKKGIGKEKAKDEAKNVKIKQTTKTRIEMDEDEEVLTMEVDGIDSDYPEEEGNFKTDL